MSIGERIRQRRKELKLSAEYVAKQLGKDRATIYRYESKDIENMPLDVLEPLAKILEVTPAYLMGWEEIKPNKLNKEYPYFPVAVSAGLPISIEPISNNEVETISMPDALMGKWAGRKDIYFMRVNGESMNKTIPHNSLIAVKQVELSCLNNGDIVVYSNHHDYSVKRFYNDKQNERFIFKPDSTDPSFTDYIVHYSEAENLKLHGKVVLYVVEL